MLAKLIAHGPDRETARVRLVEGLRTLAIPGVTTNQAFLADCLERADFVQGVHTTAFLSKNFAEGWKPDRNTLLRLRGQAALASLGDGETPLTRIDGFRIAGRRHPARIPLRTEDAFGTSDITLILGNPTGVSDGEVTVELGAPAEWMRHENGRIQIAGDGIYLSLAARPLAEARLEERDEGRSEGRITAPLTGLVTQVTVAPGDTVSKGETLVVMEAMKLVHSLNAPFDGLIRSVACREGDTLNARSLLVEMEETG
jgi:acetyl/propionyl-CoA carboxylase alpha subunit